MTNDMTKGSVRRHLLSFMIPTCLGSLFQQLYNVVDSIIAGRFIGVDALAAIGSTGSLMFFVVGWLNGLAAGFAILVAQCFGAKKEDMLRRYGGLSLVILGCITIAMTALLLVWNRSMLQFMNSPKELLDDIELYMSIIYCGLIATAAYNIFSAVLRALGDSRSPLYFLLISAGLNIILDITFIIVFKMGVEGCAYATVIAQSVSALLCLIYIILRFPILHLHKKDFAFSFPMARRLLGIGIPMGLQFSITAIGTIIVQGAVNIYGTDHMAGFSAGSKLQGIGMTVFVAFGTTLATFVGQNRGAGRFDRVRAGVRMTAVMVFVWSLVMIFAVRIFGRHMLYVFLNPTETGAIQVGLTYFSAVTWCYPCLGMIFIFRNSLQGMGYGLVPMLGGVFELVARAAIVMAVAGRTTFFGVCLSDPSAWIAALVPLVPYYFYVMKKRKKSVSGSVAPIV